MTAYNVKSDSFQLLIFLLRVKQTMFFLKKCFLITIEHQIFKDTPICVG